MAEETIRALRARVAELERERAEPVAIVGMAFRLPGGNDSAAQLSAFLESSGVGTGPFPQDRWDVAGFADDGVSAGRIRAAGGGFLARLADFDAAFFSISPKEANCLDPQQRLVLETAWAALEDAAIDPARLRHGDGGVYLGASSVDYTLEMGALPDDELDGYLAAGVLHSAVSGRLSYFLGLRGPSITVDTACSASLVSLHLAAQGLRGRECDIALCGGVNAIHHPRSSVLLSDMGALAPDGRCKTFDESADGYARSEGCGVLVLKRLSDAVRDGDTVLAVVRGSAVRQDGESAGLTAPNGAAQVALIRAALARSGLAPADISYVEAHGTGTPLGDPIELAALDEVFHDSHTRDAPLLVGSLKTNIGHMEAAAGIGGVIKTVLQLRSGTVYPHHGLERPSGRIPWDDYPIRVPAEPVPWTTPVRRALVNSFGFTGTISSVVLEQAPAVERQARPAGPGVFTLSAKTQTALDAKVEQHRRWLAENPGVDVADACYTAAVGRAHFRHRLAGLVRDRDDLAALLAREPVAPRSTRKVAFLCTGQGAQYPGMGAALYLGHPVFAAALDECDRLLTPLVGRSVRDLVLGGPDPALDRTRYTQPALFAVEYALAELWKSWGVRPTAVAGHSVGEVSAAAIAGLLDLPDAAALVAARGRLMGESAPGAMVSVSAAAADLPAHPDVAVAAVNAPDQCVLSGPADAVAEVVAGLAVETKALAVGHAFHSPLMAETAERFRAAIAGISFHKPDVSIISTVTGEVAKWRDLADPEYWVRQILAPVDFLGAMSALHRRGRHAVVEIGPGSTLVSLAKACVPAADHVWLTSLRSADPLAIEASLARAYTAGLPISWADVHTGRERTRVPLPGYPFERKAYWLSGERPSAEPVAAPRAARTPAAAELDPAVLTADPETRAAAVRELIRALLAGALDFAHPGEVDPDTEFGELGVDSLVAAELRKALSAALPVECPAAAVFDHPTARRLAQHLGGRLAPAQIG